MIAASFFFRKSSVVLKFWEWIMPSFEYPLLPTTFPYFPAWIDSCQHCAELRAFLEKHPKTTEITAKESNGAGVKKEQWGLTEERWFIELKGAR